MHSSAVNLSRGDALGKGLHPWRRLQSVLEDIVAVLPRDEQDADEAAWKKRFSEKRDVIRRLAQEAILEDERGETHPLDNLL
jgi:hypothetical protein